MPLVVALAAYIPARRAAGMSAIAAISAGSAPKRGQGLKVQRKLAGSRLPRSVSMGLGLPFARPARSALTLAAVLLGVTTVVFANGLARAMTGVSARLGPDRRGDVRRQHATEPGRPAGPDAMEQAMRATPGVAAVSTQAGDMVGVAGMTTAIDVQFYGGDSAQMGWTMVRGHWLNGPDQIVAPSRFLNRHHLSLGQTLTLETERPHHPGHHRRRGHHRRGQHAEADWTTFQQLSPGRQADDFEVRAAPGTDQKALAAKLQEPGPSLAATLRDYGEPQRRHAESSPPCITVILSLVAALGVFNTVLLNTRERRRDLGMLKSVGMTPRQVMAMIVTSMGLLGLHGGLVGLPLGYGLYQVVVPLMEHAQGMDLPPSLTTCTRHHC